MGIKKAISANMQSGIFDMSDQIIRFDGVVDTDFKKLQNSYVKINGIKVYTIEIMVKDSYPVWYYPGSMVYMRWKLNKSNISMIGRNTGSFITDSQFRELLDGAYGKERFKSAEKCFDKRFSMFQSLPPMTFDDIKVIIGDYKFIPEKVVVTDKLSPCLINFEEFDIGPRPLFGNYYMGPETDYEYKDKDDKNEFKDKDGNPLVINGPENEQKIKDGTLRFKKGILKYYAKMNGQEDKYDTPEPDKDTPPPSTIKNYSPAENGAGLQSMIHEGKANGDDWGKYR